MGRWEPNARARLETAAFELFYSRGYDRTTVSDIAERAGLTERTYFRYFADKREVLFGGVGVVQNRLAEGVLSAAADATPLEAVAAGLECATEALEVLRDREHAKKRQGLVVEHPEIRERELFKLEQLSSTLAGALRQRSVPEPTATLAAEAGIAVFKLAYQAWASGTVELTEQIAVGMTELRSLLGAPPEASPTDTARAAKARPQSSSAKPPRSGPRANKRSLR